MLLASGKFYHTWNTWYLGLHDIQTYEELCTHNRNIYHWTSQALLAPVLGYCFVSVKTTALVAVLSKVIYIGNHITTKYH